ncbi:hydroxyacylglutathione hydrolase [Candidatus Providencia siddallii]|uniref:Hydroxyacylglutathione hydrolase n=1 Tax=Candidatus Providencia siddallii TaxID=1715285 RepID=A0ABP1CFU9_9GAMM
MKLIRIPALKDNIIWILLNNNQQCIIIDPSESKNVLKIIISKQLNPIAILLTHHHSDHVNGVINILNIFPKILIFGPKEILNQKITKYVNNDDKLNFDNFNIKVISLPGHTLGHVAFYQPPYLFSGDVLFSGGCGRVVDGTYEQLFNSIKKITLLPNDTIICYAHEYTLNNLKFAKYIWPENKIISKYQKKIIKKILNKKNIFTTLKIEKKINIFLQCNNLKLQKKLQIKNPSEKSIFSFLRKLKDKYYIF